MVPTCATRNATTKCVRTMRVISPRGLLLMAEWLGCFRGIGEGKGVAWFVHTCLLTLNVTSRCPSCNGSRWTPPNTCCMDELGTVRQYHTAAFHNINLATLHTHTSIDLHASLVRASYILPQSGCYAARGCGVAAPVFSLLLTSACANTPTVEFWSKSCRNRQTRELQRNFNVSEEH